MSTFEEICALLQENLSIDPASVSLDDTFESLKIDSLDLVELIVCAEERFNIDFGEPEDLATVGDLVAYIDTLRK